MNSTKECPEHFKGSGQLNKSFEANHTRKFTRKFGNIFVTEFLRGTFSVPDLRGPFPRTYLAITIPIYRSPEPLWARNPPKRLEEVFPQAFRPGASKKRRKSPQEPHLLGSVFGRADFSRIFIFEPPDFLADFLAGFVLLIFVGKSAQKNPPGKSPGKSSKIYTTKILRHISADWPGQHFDTFSGTKKPWKPETLELEIRNSQIFSEFWQL